MLTYHPSPAVMCPDMDPMVGYVTCRAMSIGSSCTVTCAPGYYGTNATYTCTLIVSTAVFQLKGAAPLCSPMTYVPPQLVFACSVDYTQNYQTMDVK